MQDFTKLNRLSIKQEDNRGQRLHGTQTDLYMEETTGIQSYKTDTDTPTEDNLRFISFYSD